MVDALRAMKPVVLPRTRNQPLIYCHPLIYRNENLCWEAERERRHDCLAVRNTRHAAPLDLQQQVCATCNMRSYVAAVIVELPRQHSHAQMAELRRLIELSNRYLSRLFKVDHYYNRMRDSDVIIAQMATLMQSMADPVILTDSQHGVVTPNKAAERFFQVPNDVTEAAAR